MSARELLSIVLASVLLSLVVAGDLATQMLRHTVPAEAQPSLPAPSARTLEALLGGPAGVFAVIADRPERLAPGEPQAPSVLVQADTRRGQESDRRVRMPIAITGEAARRWTLRVRVAPDGSPVEKAQRLDEWFAGEAGPVRALTESVLEPGSYAATAVLLQRDPGTGAWIAAVARHALVAPDLTTRKLTAGPIVLGREVASAGPEEQDRPFVFARTRLTPALSNRFRQDDDLHFALRIFNWEAAQGEPPDLAIEYVFYRQVGSRLRFFNKLKPQALNGRTLRDAFDGRGRVVSTGMTVPLASFPAGDFELTVRVRDVRNQAAVAQQVRFTVGGESRAKE